MATEELIVLLDAKTQKLDAKLRATEKRLDDFEGSTGKADKSLLSLSDTTKAVGAGLLKVATVVLAVNAAVTAMVLSSAAGRKQLELLAKQARTSTADFQSLAFAVGQYGFDAAKIADASKDITDRIGEFSAAGTGVFQDYIDVMKISKDEARAAAMEFEGLGSQEILGTMVSRMEAANVTGDKMTFVLESMANDLSKLQPLFTNNSKELNTLKERFKSVNEELQITGSQVEQLKEVSKSYELMTAQLGNAATAISATLAPVMDDFFNDVISVVPEATQTIIDFANSFLDAENISSQAGVLKEITDSQAELVNLELMLADAKAQVSRGGSGLVNTAELQVASAEALIEKETKRTEALNAQLIVLREQELSLENANRLKGGEIGGETGTVGEGVGTGDQIEAIADRFRTEEELLVRKLENELLLIGDNEEQKLNLENEFFEKSRELQLARAADKAKIDEDGEKHKLSIAKQRQKTEQSLERSNVQSLMSISSSILGQSEGIGQALFLGSQALALSETFVNTQAASIKALTIDPTGILSAKVQTAGNISMAAIAATTLSGIGGGGGSGGISGNGGVSTSSNRDSAPDPQSFQQETSSLELTDSGSSGSQVTAVPFTTDSGDELMDVISKLLNERKAQGRT
jgi:hypothetical protein